MPLWGVWKYEPGPDGKPTKVPYNPKTDYRAKPNTPSTFGTRAQAERALATRNYSGLCYLVDASVGITAGDLDHVVSEADAFNEDALPPAVRRIIRIANTDTTWSPSGTGIHFIFGTTISGYENRNGARVICHAEAYNRVRFMTHTDRRVPGTPVTFNDDPDDLIAWLEALGFRKREAEQPPQPQPERAILSLATEEIITRASNASAKFRELYDGGLCGKQSASEARYALMSSLLFWTRDPGQIEDIVRSSGQWNAKTKKRPELVRKEIDKLLRAYTGPQYDPSHRGTSHLTIVPNANANANADALSCADVRAELVAAHARIAELEATVTTRERVIERERELRIAAEERAERLSFERSQVMHVLRATDLHPGQKLTHFADVLDLGGRIANGEKPTAAGFRTPAYNTAKMTGQKVEAVRRHRNELAKRGIYVKKNVREATEKDTVDPETGEIMTATGMREVTHIHVPENNIIHLITPAVAYTRPDDAPKRGGKRTPRCKDHPDAGTIKRWTIECAECGIPLDRGVDDPVPASEESSPIKLEREPHVGNTVLNRDISAPETVAASPPPSHAKFERQPLITEPPPEPDPWWWQGVGS